MPGEFEVSPIPDEMGAGAGLGGMGAFARSLDKVSAGAAELP